MAKFLKISPRSLWRIFLICSHMLRAKPEHPKKSQVLLSTAQNFSSFYSKNKSTRLLQSLQNFSTTYCWKDILNQPLKCWEKRHLGVSNQIQVLSTIMLCSYSEYYINNCISPHTKTDLSIGCCLWILFLLQKKKK